MQLIKIMYIVMALVFVGCTSTPKEEEKLVEETERQKLANEVKDEITIGRTMASKLLGVMGHYENKKAHEYLNLVGGSLVASVGRPEIKYHFAILDTNEVNAYAAPGGYIFVTKGLFKMIRSESELAAVLGHEIDHVNSKHMYKTIMPKREVSAGENLTRLMSRGASDIAGSLSQAVTAGMKMLMEEGWGQEKEYEADRNGVLYASTIGYDPYSLPRLLRRIQKKKSTIQVSKTHPEYGPRIKALRGALADMGLDKGLKGKKIVLAKRFRSTWKSIK